MSNLLVIAAPSGAGKTSLVKALSQSIDSLCISVSHTTRAMRPGEVDGQDYFFIEHPTFDAMIADNTFLEYATVFGQHYGTSRSWVERQLANEIDVVLEIDWQGARQIKQLFPSAILVFILPPSMEALMDRLRNRKQDDAATIICRMQAAQDEMQHFGEFDYLVVNDQFDLALLDLQHIVRSGRLKTAVQKQKKAALLDNLLNKQ
ncbi:MAG: guanylate kinase [Coxiellaceae bacterium]|nr:guanylate kinase [Coxiellaceae bacterium]